MLNLCKHGCGKEGRYQNADGSWRCSKWSNSCSKVREKIGERLTGDFRPTKVRSTCPYCSRELRCNKNTVVWKRHLDNCYLNPKNLKLCPVCDKPVKNWQETTTCSHSCSNTYFRTGENHGAWKGNDYVLICFRHHEKKCIVCEEKLIVSVHHFDCNHENNSPDNLIPLCLTHHKYYHSRYKHLVEEDINKYRDKWIKDNL